MEKQTKSKKYVAHPLRQLIWRHMANYSCLSDGRQYQHLISSIILLRKIVGEVELKIYLGERYLETNKKLIEFEKLTNHITAFCSLIEKKDYRGTSFFNDKFRLYFNSLQQLPLIHQEILEVFVFLLNQTTLSQTTIPSTYIVQANKELVFSTEEEERKRRSFIPRGRMSSEEKSEAGFSEESEKMFEEDTDED